MYISSAMFKFSHKPQLLGAHSLQWASSEWKKIENIYKKIPLL